MFQNQCANLQTFFENAGFLSIFYDISCGFVVLFNDPYALIFVVLAAIVGIVFGALAWPNGCGRNRDDVADFDRI